MRNSLVSFVLKLYFSFTFFASGSSTSDAKQSLMPFSQEFKWMHKQLGHWDCFLSKKNNWRPAKKSVFNFSLTCFFEQSREIQNDSFWRMGLKVFSALRQEEKGGFLFGYSRKNRRSTIVGDRTFPRFSSSRGWCVTNNLSCCYSRNSWKSDWWRARRIRGNSESGEWTTFRNALWGAIRRNFAQWGMLIAFLSGDLCFSQITDREKYFY